MNEAMSEDVIQCEEEQLEVNELNYCFKRWRHPKWAGQPCFPVLALHGWLDNANSFDVLAPQLLARMPLEIVALDMAGHGLSGHRHVQGHYNIWDDLPDLAKLIDQLGWENCVLLGHSRGAMISTLLVTAALKRVKAMVLLDGLLPIAIEPEEAPKQLYRFLKQKIRQPNFGSSYDTKEQAIEARCRAANMLPETARPIIERALYRNQQQRLVWRSDPRLNHPSAFKLSREHNDAFLQRVGAPTLLLLASKGLADYCELSVSSLDLNPLIEREVIDGSHHFHLEQEPSRVAAERIETFLRRILYAEPDAAAKST